MKLCSICGTQNREGLLFCEECGQNLINEASIAVSTRQIDVASQDARARTTWGTARFRQDSIILLHVRDAPQPIVLQPNYRTILGRADNDNTPDVDLSPFNALDKGVSRNHAAILHSDDTLTLVDLGSANGSYLNGQRLIREQPRVLRDGDEIRLGKLVIHIYFKSGTA